jgi:hypothetical protein
MKASNTLLAVFLVASAAARAQVVPAVEGPYGSPISGTLHYDLRYMGGPKAPRRGASHRESWPMRIPALCSPLM